MAVKSQLAIFLYLCDGFGEEQALIVSGLSSLYSSAVLVKKRDRHGMYLADDVLTLSRLRVGRCGCGFVVLPAGREWDEEECHEGEC